LAWNFALELSALKLQLKLEFHMQDNRDHSHLLARLPRLAGRGLLAIYRFTLSPLIGPRCRHLPTCSDYADEAVGRFGLWAGGWMVMARILRCQPLGTSGLDFVPAALPETSCWYLPWRYGRWRGTNETPSA
jgi:uncharacterized protein